MIHENHQTNASVRSDSHRSRGRRLKRRARAGFTVLLALSMVMAISVLIVVGLDRRTDDLAFEPRALCRVIARAAAESAVARIQAQLETRGSASPELSGALPAERHRVAKYEAHTSNAGAIVRVAATGSCTDGDGTVITRTIEAELERRSTGWVMRSWSE